MQPAPDRSGEAPGDPSGRVNIGANGKGFTPAATRSAPVMISHHTRHGSLCRRGVD